jgi:hypothetical protein
MQVGVAEPGSKSGRARQIDPGRLLLSDRVASIHLGPRRLADLRSGRRSGCEKNTELPLLPQTMVGRQFDRSGRKVFDRGAGRALELGTKEHRTGFGRRFEAETRSEFEEICDPWSEPAEIGEGLGEQSAVFAVSSNPDADDLALSADREQVDGRGFREETFGDHPNAWIEASEPVSDGTT